MGRHHVTSVLACATLVFSGCMTAADPADSTGGHATADITRDTSGVEPQPGAPASAQPRSGATSPPASASAPSGSVTLGPTTMGIATFYDADGTGNCSFPASPQDRMVVAPNKARYYAGSAICGACMHVTGPKGSVLVRVVDSCPLGAEDGDCGQTGADLDLSAEAFAVIDDPDEGVANVTFALVACPVTGPISFTFKSGSSQWWTAIQIRNHRLPVATVEYAARGGWVAMEREDDDFFVAPSGVGPSPNGISLRVTSSTGEVIEDTVPRVAGGQTFGGTQQFP